jgi:hypothetical protein
VLGVACWSAVACAEREQHGGERGGGCDGEDPQRKELNRESHDAESHGKAVGARKL